MYHEVLGELQRLDLNTQVCLANARGFCRDIFRGMPNNNEVL
jgi:hypothetical protein